MVFFAKNTKFHKQISLFTYFQRFWDENLYLCRKHNYKQLGYLIFAKKNYL